MIKNMMLCAGRHSIPDATDGAILPHEVNPVDIDGMAAAVAATLGGVTHLNLYVTGLTVALVEVIKHCADNNVGLTLYHYDRDSGTYYPQVVFTRRPTCGFCGAVMYGWHCSSCGAT